MAELGVMHLVDTLAMGGTERVAVNIANQLASQGHRSFLCTTRRDGPLSGLVSPQVGRLSLDRTRTIQLGAIRRLADFIRSNDIKILHAHGSSIVTANLVSRLSPFPKIVWHDHYGTNERKERSVWLYRWLVRRVGGIVAVSRPLADWSRRRLRFPSDRVWCVPNFVESIDTVDTSEPKLPGTAGSRIVCVANLRPVKDHLTLLAAMSRITDRRPDAHLILVGSLSDSSYVTRVKEQLQTGRLEANVSILGQRQDVPAILRGCDVGVLSSTSEGLPVSLLEYGAAGLPVVVTEVGQCADVVGETGRTVASGSPEKMATQILSLLDDPQLRDSLGCQFNRRVEQQFGAAQVMEQWINIYEKMLEAR